MGLPALIRPGGIGAIVANLMLIDGDPSLIPGQVCQAFPDSAHRVVVVGTGAERLKRVDTGHPAVILLDLGLPDQSGLRVYQQIRRRDARIPVMFVTMAKTADAAIEAMKQGAYDYRSRRRPTVDLPFRPNSGRSPACGVATAMGRHSHQRGKTATTSKTGRSLQVGPATCYAGRC